MALIFDNNVMKNKKWVLIWHCIRIIPSSLKNPVLYKNSSIGKNNLTFMQHHIRPDTRGVIGVALSFL